jgi:hypothetical protein
LRTLIVIVIGIALLFVLIAIAAALSNRRIRGPFDGAMIFVWLWLAFVIVDGYVGVRGGHGLLMEIAIHALVFALPAGLAWYLSRQHRSTLLSAVSPRQE